MNYHRNRKEIETDREDKVEQRRKNGIWLNVSSSFASFLHLGSQGTETDRVAEGEQPERTDAAVSAEKEAGVFAEMKSMNRKNEKKSDNTISSNVAKVLKGAAAAGLAIGGVAVMNEETNMDVYAAGNEDDHSDGDNIGGSGNDSESNSPSGAESSSSSSSSSDSSSGGSSSSSSDSGSSSSSSDSDSSSNSGSESSSNDSHESSSDETHTEETHESHEEGDKSVSTDTKTTETEHKDEGSSETKTETKVTEDSKDEDSSYPDSFGTKDEEKSSTDAPVTNEDGSTTTTEHNVYTGEDGSTTEETVTKTVTPGSDPETKELENDGTEHTAVKVDENGAPVLDENGNPVTETVTDWKGTETTTTGETTEIEYTAKTTTTEKAASATETGVDQSRTEWQLTDNSGNVVTDAEGKPIVISTGESQPSESDLTATPNEDGTYTLTYGEQTYTLTADQVKDSETLFHVTAKDGKQISTDNVETTKVTEENGSTHEEVAVTQNADGTYSIKDKAGNTIAVDSNEVKSRTAETGETIYYIDNGTAEGVTLENGTTVKEVEKTESGYDLTLSDNKKVAVSEEQAKGHVITNPEGSYEYKDSKGSTQKASSKDDSLKVEQKTDEQGNAVYTAKKEDGTELTFDSAEKDENAGDSAYYFTYKAADGENVKVTISKNQLIKAEKQTEGTHKDQYKVTVDGKDYYVDAAETEKKLTIGDQVISADDLTKDGKVAVEKQADGSYTKKLSDGSTLTVSVTQDNIDEEKYVYIKDENGNDQKYYLKDQKPVQDVGGNWTIDGKKISDTSIKVTEKGQTTSDTFEIEVNDGEGTKKITVATGADQEVFKNAEGKYVIRDGEKEYVITNQGAVKTILTAADPIYEGDSDLAKISKILGDYGVTANHRDSSGHMDSNYRYGDSNAYIEASSNANYVKEANNKGGDAYIGYVTQDINNAAKSTDASSTKTLHINLKKDEQGRETQELVKVDSIYYVRELTLNSETGKYEFKSGNAEHKLQNFENVIVEQNDIAAQIQSDINEIATAANSLHGKQQSVSVDITPSNDYNGQKNWIDTTSNKEKIVYVNLGVNTSADGTWTTLQYLTEADKTRIKFNENQTIVFNVDTGNLGKDSTINLFKYQGIVVDKQGKEQSFIAEHEGNNDDEGSASLKFMSHLVFNFGNYEGTVYTKDHFGGFLILPKATLSIGTTSSGRAVADTYKTGGSEWHYYGSNDSGESYVITPTKVPGASSKDKTEVSINSEYFVAPVTTTSLKGTEGKLDKFYVKPEAVPTYSYTPLSKAGTSTVYYIVPEADKVASTTPQYYKVTVTEYSKRETITSKDVTRKYVFTVETPETPETPEKPETPETPDKPETPEKPTTPETPETPDKPTTPETPETPTTPETPEKPETPETPEEHHEEHHEHHEHHDNETPSHEEVKHTRESTTHTDDERRAVLGANRRRQGGSGDDTTTDETGGSVRGASRGKGGTSGGRNAQTGDESQMNLYAAGMATGAAALAAWGVAKKKAKKDAEEE